MITSSIILYFLLWLFVGFSHPSALAAQQLDSRDTPVLSLLDSDRDGFPDAVELTSPTDRLNFRRWFTFIAELQFYHPSRRWSQVNYDCAGLVRYAFIEALKKHTPRWHQNMGLSELLDIPDVKKYNYPEVPILGVKVFRVGEGYCDAESGGRGDAAVLLSPRPHVSVSPCLSASVAADAYHLMTYNTVFLGREEVVAQKGDLLFFLNPYNLNMPYHVMIFVGKEEGVVGGEEDWLVYHTGPDNTSPGEVRKVQRSLLKQHPNPKWRPMLGNPNFLGYFRWKILD